MSDTVYGIDPGTILVPAAGGENTTESFAVFFPSDGFLQTALDAQDASATAQSCRDVGGLLNAEAMAVRITIERLDP